MDMIGFKTYGIYLITLRGLFSPFFVAAIIVHLLYQKRTI
jgi:hypothetical protein